jgi:hypothetical protein
MSQQLPYTYSSLNTTIRLLRVSRHGEASEITGELESFCLDSPNCPHFMTLSYVWGSSPVYNKSISLRGGRLPVLESLYPFLDLICNLQESSRNQWWWIDSVCIDQNNAYERDSQVQLMGRIYTQAIKSIVWLGGKSEDSDLAMDFLTFLQKRRWQFDKGGTVERSAFRELRQQQFQAKWKAVENLLLRPWWKRVWTLQEFIVAPKLELFCGNKSIPRSSFKSAMYAIWLAGGADGKLISKAAFEAGWSRRRIHQWYQDTQEMPLVAAIAYLGDSDATHQRDRIYSLLTLVGPEDRKLIGKPDYTTSLVEVYSKLVRDFVENYKNLDITCFAHDFVSPTSDTSDLPSWVPNWSVKVRQKVVPLMVSQGQGRIGNFRPLADRDSTASYKASGISTPVIDFPAGNRILTCQGVELDYINGLGGGDSETYIQSTSTPNHEPANAQYGDDHEAVATCTPDQHTDPPDSQKEEAVQLLTRISRSLVLDRADRYLNHHANAERVSSELEAFCRAAQLDPKSVHPRFLTWYQQNRHLKFKGWTLEKLCQVINTTASTAYTDFKNTLSQDALLNRLWDTVTILERRLLVTEQGHVGMAPFRARKGDLVCVLFGCSVPVVLRRIGDDRIFEFIGECYLDGFMAGEALKDVESGRRTVGTFRLH